MNHGSWGWVAVAAGIATFDAHAAVTGRETLSMAFTRATSQPSRRPWVIGSWAYITAHLFGTLPGRLDPLRAIGARR